MQELPEIFLERLKRILPESCWEPTLQSFRNPRAVVFRFNRIKPPSEFKTTPGLKVRTVAWYEDAFVLVQGTIRDLQNTPAYEEGGLYIQELSSMVPVLLLEPQPGEQVLDLTAAPGSKTGQIAALMKNTGRILANDVSRARFFKMKANLEKLGVSNVEYSVAKGENVGRRLREKFDRVLLDAPCSGEGRFHLTDPESFQEWKLSKMKGLVPRQKMLFYSAWQTLKPGGVLVYSTCTFAPEENEGILDWAIEKFPDLEMLPAELAISNRMDGLTGWGKHTYHPSVAKALRILPADGMEGFFAAKMHKKNAAG